MFTMNVSDKVRKDDRILVLKPIDGKPKSSLGNVDTRLFTGGNNLHCVMNTQTCFWYFKYDVGGLPFPLRDVQFTSFKAAYNHAANYFKSRNIEIVEIKD